MSEWQPTEQSLMAIHSVSKTDAGKALSGYVQSVVDAQKLALIHGHSPLDAAAIAHSQAAIRLGEGFLWLLEASIEELLEQYNIKTDEGDDDEA